VHLTYRIPRIRRAVVRSPARVSLRRGFLLLQSLRGAAGPPFTDPPSTLKQSSPGLPRPELLRGVLMNAPGLAFQRSARTAAIVILGWQDSPALMLL
jgi:hypothetical protein